MLIIVNFIRRMILVGHGVLVANVSVQI